MEVCTFVGQFLDNCQNRTLGGKSYPSVPIGVCPIVNTMLSSLKFVGNSYNYGRFEYSGGVEQPGKNGRQIKFYSNCQNPWGQGLSIGACLESVRVHVQKSIRVTSTSTRYYS